MNFNRSEYDPGFTSSRNRPLIIHVKKTYTEEMHLVIPTRPTNNHPENDTWHQNFNSNERFNPDTDSELHSVFYSNYNNGNNATTLHTQTGQTAIQTSPRNALPKLTSLIPNLFTSEDNDVRLQSFVYRNHPLMPRSQPTSLALTYPQLTGETRVPLPKMFALESNRKPNSQSLGPFQPPMLAKDSQNHSLMPRSQPTYPQETQVVAFTNTEAKTELYHSNKAMPLLKTFALESNRKANLQSLGLFRPPYVLAKGSQLLHEAIVPTHNPTQVIVNTRELQDTLPNTVQESAAMCNPFADHRLPTAMANSHPLKRPQTQRLSDRKRIAIECRSECEPNALPMAMPPQLSWQNEKRPVLVPTKSQLVNTSKSNLAEEITNSSPQEVPVFFQSEPLQPLVSTKQGRTATIDGKPDNLSVVPEMSGMMDEHQSSVTSTREKSKEPATAQSYTDHNQEVPEVQCSSNERDPEMQCVDNMQSSGDNEKSPTDEDFANFRPESNGPDPYQSDVSESGISPEVQAHYSLAANDMVNQHNGNFPLSIPWLEAMFDCGTEWNTEHGVNEEKLVDEIETCELLDQSTCYDTCFRGLQFDWEPLPIHIERKQESLLDKEDVNYQEVPRDDEACSIRTGWGHGTPTTDQQDSPTSLAGPSETYLENSQDMFEHQQSPLLQMLPRTQSTESSYQRCSPVKIRALNEDSDQENQQEHPAILKDDHDETSGAPSPVGNNPVEQLPESCIPSSQFCFEMTGEEVIIGMTQQTQQDYSQVRVLDFDYLHSPAASQCPNFDSQPQESRPVKIQRFHTSSIDLQLPYSNQKFGLNQNRKEFSSVALRSSTVTDDHIVPVVFTEKVKPSIADFSDTEDFYPTESSEMRTALANRLARCAHQRPLRLGLSKKHRVIPLHNLKNIKKEIIIDQNVSNY